MSRQACMFHVTASWKIYMHDALYYTYPTMIDKKCNSFTFITFLSDDLLLN